MLLKTATKVLQHLQTSLFFKTIPFSYHFSTAEEKEVSETTAKIIDGVKISKDISDKIKEEIGEIRKENKDWIPGLAILQVGSRKESNAYVNNKKKFAKELGFKFELRKFPETVTEIELLRAIEELNDNQKIHGIIVQLPLPEHLNPKNLVEKINPLKDVDAHHPYNVGKLATFEAEPYFEPCTPRGIMRMLSTLECDPSGKHAVIVGFSNIVGKLTYYNI